MDDITGGCNNEEWLAHFKSYINNLFKITDLGELSPLLGLEINQTGEYTTISQQKYIKELLHRFEMTESSTQDLPLNPTFKVDPTTVTDSEYAEVKDYPYKNLLGALLWIARCSRPDISSSVGILSKYCMKYSLREWNALVGILKYLKGTINLCIRYSKNPYTTPNQLSCYADSSFQMTNPILDQPLDT